MLEIDYSFTRDQGNIIEKFSPPQILKDISSNIIVLEAPNGSGKSTLLNILAIGLYGNRLDKTKCHISDSLLERMTDLIGSQKHELTFSFTMHSPDNKQHLISSKINPKTKDIEVYEVKNNIKSLLTDVTFPQKYYLIYDIPEDPLKRLPYLIQQIKSQQSNIGNQVIGLKNYIHGLLTEIKESKDPHRIEELRKQIQDLTTEIERRQKTHSEDNSILEKLIFYQALKFSRHYRIVKETLEFEIEKFSGTIANIDRNKKTKNTQFDNQKQNAIDIFEIINRNRSELLKLIDNILSSKKNKKIAENIRYFEKYDPYQMLSNFKFDTKFLETIDFLHNKIESEKSDKELLKISEKSKFYSEILNLLKLYENQNFSIPGINKSLNQLISDIEEEKNRNSKFVTIVENYQKSNELLESIKGEVEKLPDILSKLETLSTKIKKYTESNGDYESIYAIIESRRRNYDTTLTKIATYTQILSPTIHIDDFSKNEIEDEIDNFEKNNKELTPFFHFTEDQITQEISKLNHQVTTLSQKIGRDEKIREKYQRDLTNQENKKPHLYQDNYEELNNLYSKCEKLERTIRKLFGTYLNDLENKKKAENEEERKFYEAISIFLSKRIPEVPYIEQMIQTSKVDLVNQEIIDKTGERHIPFSAISTGQGISIYLKSLLNLPKEDPRKIIAFFDEIATMDSKSLNHIIKDLKSLNDNQRLLCAILVQKSDNFKIHNIKGN